MEIELNIIPGVYEIKARSMLLLHNSIDVPFNPLFAIYFEKGDHLAENKI